jgi:hypothetical protein
MRANSWYLIASLCVICASGAVAQQATVSSSVPRLVSFGGVIKGAAGKPVEGVVPVTFSLFAPVFPLLYNERDSRKEQL